MRKDVTRFGYVLGALLVGLTGAGANAQTDIGAKKLIEMAAGQKVPGDHQLISQVDALLKAGRKEEAAELALSHPGFLNITVKQMALKMSTRDESLLAEFNDFAAGFVGVVRDQRDARLLLRGNFYYDGDPSRIPAGMTVRSDLVADLLNSNNHYADLDKPGIDLGAVLRYNEGQRIYSGSTRGAVNNPDPAGILTSRSFLSSHVIAGTNRRAVEHTFRQFMCVTIEEWADSQASAERIGRDIDRNPGNNPTKFETSCKACHTVMDGFRGAFAYWNFQNNPDQNQAWVANSQVETQGLEGMGFLANRVARKMNHNEAVFPNGYVTTNNSWVNNAVGPANWNRFGWRATSQAILSGGMGVRGLGSLVSDSRRFSECMVKRVFESACRPKNLNIEENKSFVRSQADQLEASNYNLKKLYARVLASEECVK